MHRHSAPAPCDRRVAALPRGAGPRPARVPGERGRRACGAAVDAVRRSHGVGVFLATTTAVSAVFWVVGRTSDARILVPGLPVSALMFVAPLVGAVAACPRAEWRAAIRRIRTRSRRATVAAIGTAAAWAPLMPAVVLAASLLASGSMRADGGLGAALRLGAVATALFLITATAEELGWTWYLTRRLGRLPVWEVALLIGAIWAALHVIPWLQAGRDWMWIAAQSAFSIVFRFALVAAFRLTARMGVVIAMHATYNTAWVLLEESEAGYAPGLTALVLLPVASVVWLLGRRGTGGAASPSSA